MSVEALDYMTACERGGKFTTARQTNRERHEMHLIRTRPFRFVDDVDALLDTLPRPGGVRFGFRDGRSGHQVWLPRVDIVETGEALTVRYEVAGFRLEDLEVTLDDNLLTVKGERSADLPEEAAYRLQEIVDGSFTRSIRVGEHFDPEAVQATLRDGILEVVLQKRPEVLPRAIAIEATRS